MTPEVHGGLPILASAITVALIFVALIYLRGWYKLRSAIPDALPAWRLAVFIGGLFAVWAAAGSPLADLDHHLLIAHMAQHLVLMTVAAPLILLGAPVIVLSRGLPEDFLRRVQPLLRSKPAREVGRSITHPAFCWLASTFVVIGYHVPSVFEMAMRSELGHAAEHASFLTAGLLFWWPVIQPWPSASRWPRWSVPLYLFLAPLPCDALSAFLTFCDRVVYPHYLAAPGVFDISALADQQSAGALMWIWVTFAYLVPAAAIAYQLLSASSLKPPPEHWTHSKA